MKLEKLMEIQERGLTVEDLINEKWEFATETRALNFAKNMAEQFRGIDAEIQGVPMNCYYVRFNRKNK